MARSGEDSTVYLLHHVYEDEAHEDVKLIGVFSSEAKARALIPQLLTQPGFRDYPNGFEVSSYLLDRGSWLEGFGPR